MEMWKEMGKKGPDYKKRRKGNEKEEAVFSWIYACVLSDSVAPIPARLGTKMLLTL